nr:hybrid signal transduction histidine kinase M [Tanacetum cinerariifolium]
MANPLTQWFTADSIVKSWIILTLSPSLQKRFIKINPTTARDAWERVEKLFQDNKRTHTVALKGELRMLHMGDQSANEYFSKIDSLVTLLSDLGSVLCFDNNNNKTEWHVQTQTLETLTIQSYLTLSNDVAAVGSLAGVRTTVC